MKRTSRIISATRAAVLAALILPPMVVTLDARPPQKKGQAQDALQYQVTVALKLVQVSVTDRQGRPVKDLEKSEFEIFDNGERKTITDFEKHFLAVPEKKPGGQPIIEAAQQAPPSGAQPVKLPRKFFFILDIQQNDLTGYVQSKKAALHFLDTQVQPPDEVGLLTYQVRIGLKMHEYLSSDHQRIRKAIEKLKAIPGAGTGGAATEPYEREDTQAIIRDLEFSLASAEADEARMRRMNYVMILTELAKALRYIPGTKNIIFFSAGYARSNIEEDIMFQRSLGEMSQEFGSSASPVYTVNVMGIRSKSVPFDARGDDSLKIFAESSGGRYFEDVAKVDEVATGIQNATGNYYVLGYPISEQWDGRFHEIKVTVKRPGCVVTAQSGYYNPKPFAEFSEFEKQLHLMDLAFNDHPQFQNPIELPLGFWPCRDDSGTHLVFMTELPWDGLKDVLRQGAELVYVVTDQENNVVENKRGDLQIPDVKKKRVVYYGLLPGKPGAYDCSIVLRNMTTGKAARARGSVTSPPPASSGLQLDPPILLVPEEERDVVYLRLTKTDRGPADKPSAALKDLFPYLSNRLAPVLDEIRAETPHLLAVVRSTVLGIPNAHIEFTVTLRPDGGGDETPLDMSILNGQKQGKADVLLLDLPLPTLSPGSYTLTIVAKDENSEAKAGVSRTIRVI
jgi:VWFA-related protein